MLSPQEEFINNLKQTPPLLEADKEGSLRWYLQWYKDRYPSARNKYRLVGITIIALTLIVGANWHESSLLSLAAIAALGACFLSINNFFGWGNAWRAYYLAKVRIEFALQQYENRILFSRTLADSEKAIFEIYSAYSILLKDAQSAIEEEAKTYFEGLKSPSPKGD